MRLKALFTGGGTAGHVAPNIAVIEELTKIAKRRDVDLDILYVGRFRGIERDLILKERLKYKGVFSGKIRRYFSWRNFTDPILVFFGFFQSIFIVFSFKPDVVFAKGGFVTVPVGLAAWIRKIPLIVHESDSMLGLSNKVLSKIATRLALGFPLELYRGIPLSKAIFTGNPVRKDVKEFDLNRDELCAKYGFNKRWPFLLVLGGSQGAQRINELIDSILEKMVSTYTVVHSVGAKGAGHFKERRAMMKEDLKKNYLAFSFIQEEMGDFLNAADLIISRAGANAISEILFVKKPSILIPFPYASSDHQNKNALFLQKEGLASVLEERHLTGYKLLEEIDYLLANKKEMEKMIGNMEEKFSINSEKLIAEEILKFCKD